MTKKIRRIIEVAMGLIALFFIYQSIIQVRFAPQADVAFYIILLILCVPVVALTLQHKKANYEFFRWAQPVVLFIIAAGIGLTMTEAVAWVW